MRFYWTKARMTMLTLIAVCVIVGFAGLLVIGENQAYAASKWEPVGSAGFSAGESSYTSLYVYEGTPYVAYRDYGNSNKATVMKYDGNNWVTVGGAGFSAGQADFTSLYVYEGTPYVAYKDGEHDGKTTVMKYNGSSWETVGSAGFSAGAAFSVSLVVDEGTPYVGYVDYGNSGKATVMKYNGSSWETVGSAGFSAGVSDFTSLYVYGGTPYIAYQDSGNSGRATVMKYDGSNWVTVGSAGFSSSTVMYTSLYVDNGTPFVAYQDGGSYTRATVMKYNGTNWETVGNAGFSFGNVNYLSLKVYDGTPYVVYQDAGRNYKATVKKYNGISWETVGSSGFSASMAIYTSLYVYEGTPYVAYVDVGNSSKTTVMKLTVSTEDAGSWNPVGVPGFSADAAFYNSLKVYNGTPYVAYSDYGNSWKSTVMKYNGTSWETVGSAGFSAGEASYTSLYVDNGTPYVAYRDGGNSNKATVMKYNGTSWETVGSAGFSADEVWYTSLYVDDGTPYVAYRDGGNSNKATVMKYNGTSWETVGSAGFSAGAATGISLDVDDGTPYVAYRDSGNSNKATVMKYNGTSWETMGSAGFSAGAVSGVSLDIDEGTPYVAYREGSIFYGKATVMKYNGTNWESVGNAGFSENFSSNISLFIDRGTPYVAYSASGATVMKYNGSIWEKVGSTSVSAGSASNIALYVEDSTVYVAYQDYEISQRDTVMKLSDKSTVTYDGNGAMSGTVPADSGRYGHRVSVTVLGNTGNLVKTGYSFAGWNTAADGSGTNYAAGQTFIMGADNVTLYAQWRSNNALLSNLSVDQGTLSPSFAPSTLNYSVDVDYVVSGLNVSFVQAEPVQSVTVTGAVYQSVTEAVYQTVTGAVYTYQSSGLSVGTNLIRIGVTAQDGTENEYTVTVNRASGSNADLSGLTLSSGTLSPVFASGTTAYAASVAYSVYSFTVTPTASDPQAAITVNGQSAIGGQPSGAIHLAVGDNAISIEVTARDGTKKTYTVIVNRAASSNADLNGLTLSSGTLSPVFVSGTTTYAASVANGVSSLTVTPTASDPQAAITVNGQSALGGQPSGVLHLAVGNNAISIEVTARDGTKKTYTVIVNRAADSSNDSGGSGRSGGLPPITSKDGKLTLPVGSTGEVSLDNAIVISIPSNASSNQLELSIEKLSNTQSVIPNKEVLSSPVYEVLKNFRENFSKPVTLTISFDRSKVKSGQTVAIFYFDEAKKLWVKVEGGKIDGDRISAEVDHFTKFAVLVVDGKTGLAVTEKTAETPAEVTTDAGFNDIAGHWAEALIKQAVRNGIVTGYTDGTFKPDASVTRAEFAVMLMNTLKPQGEGEALAFTDTAKIGSWARKAIAQAKQAGIINGYEDGSFRPDARMTRSEMAVMMANALSLSIEGSVSTGFADDRDIPEWAKNAVAAIKNRGLIEGKGANKFDPDAITTRAESVKVLLNILERRQ